VVMSALTRVPSAISLSGASHVLIGFDGENFLPLAAMPLSASILPLRDAGTRRSRYVIRVEETRAPTLAPHGLPMGAGDLNSTMRKSAVGSGVARLVGNCGCVGGSTEGRSGPGQLKVPL